MFNTIEIDRDNLTIMGIKFSDLKTLESTASALGSNMFEGFEPSSKGIEIIRDYVTGQISFDEFVKFAKQKTASPEAKSIVQLPVAQLQKN